MGIYWSIKYFKRLFSLMAILLMCPLKSLGFSLLMIYLFLDVLSVAYIFFNKATYFLGFSALCRWYWTIEVSLSCVSLAEQLLFKVKLLLIATLNGCSSSSAQYITALLRFLKAILLSALISHSWCNRLSRSTAKAFLRSRLANSSPNS